MRVILKMKRFKKAFFISVIGVCLVVHLVACRKMKVYEGKERLNIVRIYDVIPQGEEYLGESGKMLYESTRNETKAIEIERKERAEGILKELQNLVFVQHFYRVGLFQAVGLGSDSDIPYNNLISKVEETSGVGIEYAILDSWESLEYELEKTKDDGVTKIVLFNNSFPKSLIKELMSGKYADLQVDLQKKGFYDEMIYNQEVLKAGMLDGMQVAVPLLYNVSGMIQGERKEIDPYTGQIIYEPNLDKGKGISYEKFLDKLNDEMQKEECDEKIPFISAAILEETEPELFISASGIKWEEYANCREIFEMLYDYMSVYKETQLENGTSSQYLWGRCLEEFKYSEIGMDILSKEWVYQLGLEENGSDGYGKDVRVLHIPQLLFDRTKYFVESSRAEKIAYHSVTGLLAAHNYYEIEGLPYKGSVMYWPIGQVGENEKYAAQPINYAAVVAGGNSELAVNVIKALLDLEVDCDYGFSLNNAVCQQQLDAWGSKVDVYNSIGVRAINVLEPAIYTASATGAYWSNVMSGSSYEEKGEFVEQLRLQLNRVTSAQIPDREILEIWQECLKETVDKELSIKEGFELLCMQMDEWYGE